jgi:hypothetical protein
MKKHLFFSRLALNSLRYALAAFILLQTLNFSFGGISYYISPTGSDSFSGVSKAAAWRTFAHAWKILQPGDTLVVADGVYTEAISPNVAGTSSQPITIKAENDGKATIDGEFRRVCLNFQVHVYNQKYGHTNGYLIFEGLNFRNGVDRNIEIAISHITLRRVHSYTEYHDWESAQLKDAMHPVRVSGTAGNVLQGILIEDSIFSGMCSKVLKVRLASVTVRRVVLDWRWNPAYTDGNVWPWSGGLNIYHGRDGIYENVIALGQSANYQLNLHGNESVQAYYTDNNKYYGSIAIAAVTTPYGQFYDVGKIRPQPNSLVAPTKVYSQSWPGWKVGMTIGGIHTNTLFQDILSWGNPGYGFYSTSTDPANNNQIVRMSLINNGKGIQAPGWTISDTYVEGDANYTGPGADIRYQYVDGTKTQQALWPWPMEQRVREELGYSITNRVAAIIPEQVSAVSDIPRPIPGSDTTFLNFLSGVALGSAKTSVVQLENYGNGDLKVAGIAISNEMSGEAFRIVGGTCPSAPFTLAASQSCTLQVQFKPPALGIYSGRLRIHPSNMGRLNFPHIINLNGEGTDGGEGGSTPAVPASLKVIGISEK